LKAGDRNFYSHGAEQAPLPKVSLRGELNLAQLGSMICAPQSLVLVIDNSWLALRDTLPRMNMTGLAIGAVFVNTIPSAI
jgi:hypothetical protein